MCIWVSQASRAQVLCCVQAYRWSPLAGGFDSPGRVRRETDNTAVICQALKAEHCIARMLQALQGGTIQASYRLLQVRCISWNEASHF